MKQIMQNAPSRMAIKYFWLSRYHDKSCMFVMQLKNKNNIALLLEYFLLILVIILLFNRAWSFNTAFNLCGLHAKCDLVIYFVYDFI